MRGISRIGVAALAGMVSLLGVSSAQAIEADGSTSLTQPANTLIMPYDATEGKASYMIVSNLAGESAAGPNILTLWEWTNSLGVLEESVLACLGLNSTIVQDAADRAPGSRGMVVVTAWETDGDCLEPVGLVDNAIVGTYTFADINEQFSYGGDAIGVGLGDSGAPMLPNGDVGSIDVQTFNPQTLDDSSVAILSVAQGESSLIVSNSTSITASLSFYNNAGEVSNFSDVSVRGATFASMKPGGGLISSELGVSTSGFLRMQFSEGAIGGGSGSFIYGVHGQSVGQFGGSSNFKYTILEPLT
ncbi:MAG: hypothetical protein P8K76_18880 [Candidatus Binatia bacterium]|jgi:hypothetical protein|nr:hypothetical protein [Candidatus Binatia bacterium]MDG2011826.1 hypothetical protein [Candidatus Binatia bacterium]